MQHVTVFSIAQYEACLPAYYQSSGCTAAGVQEPVVQRCCVHLIMSCMHCCCVCYWWPLRALLERLPVIMQGWSHSINLTSCVQCGDALCYNDDTYAVPAWFLWLCCFPFQASWQWQSCVYYRAVLHTVSNMLILNKWYQYLLCANLSRSDST